jgi:membrane protein DedA with SNARE-associated domain
MPIAKFHVLDIVGAIAAVGSLLITVVIIIAAAIVGLYIGYCVLVYFCTWLGKKIC